MNTVGKILVILNFLFAIIVGVFLIMDIALRTQWKEAYFALKREAEVMKHSRDSTTKVIEKILNDYKQAQLDIDALKQKNKDTEVQMAALEDSYQVKVEDLNQRLKNSDLALAAARLAKQRLTDQITLQDQTIKNRETAIAKLEGDIKKFRTEAIQYQTQARDAQSRNEKLLDDIRKLTKDLALREAGVNPDAMVVRRPNDKNPPAVTVNGKIEKVDGDLVQISLGSDDGVNLNHTLDVFRTRPEPKYLGMIRIVDSYHRKSVARFVSTDNAALRPQLKVDDQVTSKIFR